MYERASARRVQLQMDKIAHLEVVSGDEAGRQLEVPPDGARVGRSSRNEIVLADNRLSRHHCRLYFKDGRLFVEDLNSANQTLVNERAVRDVRLAVGDVIEIGTTRLKVLRDGNKAGLRLQSPRPAGASAPAPISGDVQSRVDAVLDKEQPLPLYVRAPAWIIMALWWAFLAYSLMAPATRREKTRGADAAGPATYAPRSLPETPAEMSARLEELGVTPEQLGQLDDLKRVVVDSLKSEDYNKAIELVAIAARFQSSGKSREDLVNLGRFVRDVSTVDSLIADVFVEKIGSEVVIQHGRNSIRFIPRAVAGQQVSGTYIGADGERLMTFKIASLTPAERSRWLGNADTPERAAMQCILRMRAGDYDTARIFASNAGPLSAVLTEKAVPPPGS